MDTHAAITQAGRHPLEYCGLALGLIGTGLLLNQFILRFFAATDIWRGLMPPDLFAQELAAFNQGWPLFLLYAVAASLALLLGPRAVASALAGAAPSPAFFCACLLAAGAGAAMSVFVGGRGAGGVTLIFYWVGLGFLWSTYVGMACWAGRRSPVIRRDWTLYCYALALLPLTTLPAVPLWARLANLDIGDALITAVTISFPGHLLAAHFVIFELLDRRAARAKAKLPVQTSL